MAKYRKKTLIEAWLWSGPGATYPMPDWCAKHSALRYVTDGDGKFLGFSIETLEGEMTVSPGDWIAMGATGEIYPIKPAIFVATYEAA